LPCHERNVLTSLTPGAQALTHEPWLLKQARVSGALSLRAATPTTPSWAAG
jgi:hypothetical protein